MSQYDFGTIDPYTDDGVTLAHMLNNWRDAIHSWHRGAARPSYAVPGMAWINDNGGPTNWLVNVYLGPTVGDVVLFTYDTTTGVISNGGGMLLAQAAADPSVRWQATGNAANLRAWRATEKSDGTLRFGAYNDAGVEVAGITFQRDGKLIADLSGSSGIPSPLVVGATPPASPQPNQLWWNSDNSTAGGGRLYLYFVDVDTSQWVPASPPLGIAWTAPPTLDTNNVLLTDSGTAAFGGAYVMQSTHGLQVWSRTFTAADATHPIEVDITLFIGTGTAGGSWNGGGALFIDGAAAANAQGHVTITSGFFSEVRIYWQGVLTAGPHTFAVRFGGSALTFLNGAAGNAQGSGKLNSTMTIREVGVGAAGPQGPPGPQASILQKQYIVIANGTYTGTYSTNSGAAPTTAGGALLAQTTITPQSAASRIEVDAIVRGVNSFNITDCFMLALFNGNTLIDLQFHSPAPQTGTNLSLRASFPSPGTTPQTLSLRIGSNGGNAFAVGNCANGSGMGVPQPGMVSHFDVKAVA